MKVIMNLVRRVRLLLLALRIRFLNISIAFTFIHRNNLGQRIKRLLLRSDALGKHYRDLEGTAE